MLSSFLKHGSGILFNERFVPFLLEAPFNPIVPERSLLRPDGIPGFGNPS
jgi:hypothetical protein